VNKQFWNLFSSYGLFYMGRVNLSIVIPALLLTYDNLSLYNFGLVSMGFMGAYAIGQFLNGHLSERFNPYTFIVGGLLLSGVANVFMGFLGATFVLLLTLETMDGYFQSMGWSSIVRANSLIQSDDKSRDKSSTILGCSYQIGNSFAWLVSAFVVSWWGWQYGFWVAGAFLLFSGITLYLTKPKLELEKKQTMKKQIKGTLTFPVIMTGLSLLTVNIVRYGVLTWLFTYYVFAGNYAIAEFGNVAIKSFLVFIPLAGVCGTLIYNKLPWSKDFTSIVFLAMMGICWYLFPFTDSFTGSLLVLVSSAFLYGPHVFLVCTIPTRFKKKGLVASSTGFIDGMGYIGTTIVMLVVPYLVIDTQGGWSNVFLFWSAVSFIASITVAILYLKHFRNGSYSGMVTQ